MAAILSLLVLTTLTVPTLAPASRGTEGIAEGSLLVVDAGSDLYFPGGFSLAGLMLVADSPEPIGALRVRSNGPIDVTGTLLGGLQMSAAAGQGRSGMDLILESSERITITGRVVAMSGEDGQSAFDHALLDATPRRVGAGHGGHGGSVYLIAPAVEILGQVLSGNGGAGGAAIALGLDTVGGNGGNGGIIVKLTSEGIAFVSGGEAGSGGAAMSNVPELLPEEQQLPDLERHVDTTLPLSEILGLIPSSLIVEGVPAIPAPCSATSAKGGDGGTSLNRGGRGGDAVLNNAACIARGGANGADGNAANCNGHNAGDGTNGFSASATGGAGGVGGVSGGDGGNAEAKGGPGGSGGKGGNAYSLLSTVCDGGNGGNGGAGGAATATGGYPRGDAGAAGQAGTQSAAPGNQGATSLPC
jgi:hypothetical protein